MARVSAGGRLAFLGGCGGLWLLQREWLASGLLPGTGLIPPQDCPGVQPLAAPAAPPGSLVCGDPRICWGARD